MEEKNNRVDKIKRQCYYQYIKTRLLNNYEFKNDKIEMEGEK
jgi:hypothetical protein